MGMIDGVLMEFTHEAASTRKMLERIPADKLGWSPHPKSMTLGRLASHIAEMAAWGTTMLEQDEFVMDPATFKPTDYKTPGELLTAFDAGVSALKASMKGKSDAVMMQQWRFKVGDKVVLDLPRIAALRGMVLNHIVHHRGQLSVYLRLNDVPLPQVYGPTADEPSM